LYWYETDRSGSFRLHSLWGKGEVLQFSIAGFTQYWGQIALGLWWDEPRSSAQRERTRNLSLVFQYP